MIDEIDNNLQNQTKGLTPSKKFSFRHIKALATAFLTCLLFGYLWFRQYENGKLLESGWWIVPLFVISLRSSVYLLKERSFDSFFQDPLVRYSIAAILCTLTWEASKDADFIQKHSSSEVYLTLSFPLIMAAYFAREAVLLIIPVLLVIKLLIFLLMLLPVVDRVAVMAIAVAAVPFFSKTK